MNNDLKFALILGNSKVDGKEVDGNIDRVYIDDESTHIEYIIEYLKTHFKDDEYLQSISISTSPHHVAIYLKDLNHITFYNITSYNNGKPTKTGKCGLIIFPDELTNNQISALEAFKNDISDYSNLQIWQNFYRDSNGLLNCKNKSNLNTNMTVCELLDIVIEENKKSNIRK